MGNFKGGDYVRLKVGGPVMAFSGEMNEKGQCYCQWFDKKKLSNGWFHTDVLELVSKKDMEKEKDWKNDFGF